MKSLLKVASLLLALLSMSNSSCDKEKLNGIRKGHFGSPIALGINEKAIFSGSSTKLFLSLSSLADSRCAKDVQCVWAGNAQAKIQVMAADGTSANLDMCLGQCGKELKQADTVSLTLVNIRYTIILSDVNDSNKAVLSVSRN
jgi:hypothetical protein